jgi:hypothetical protein
MKYLVFGLSSSHWQKSVIIDYMTDLLKDGHSVTFVDADVISLSHWDFPVSKIISRAVFHTKLKVLFNKIFKDEKFEYRLSNIYLSSVSEELNSQVVEEELVTVLRDSSPCALHSKSLRCYLHLKYNATRLFASKFLDKIKPDQVVIFNGRFLLERAVWDSAISRGYNIYFLERFSPQWNDRYYLFKEPVHSTRYRSSVMLSYYENSALSSNEKSRIAAGWFEDRRLGISQNFTRGQSMQLAQPSHAQKIVSFFHSSEDELLGFGADEFDWANQFELIDTLVEVVRAKPNWKLIVRIHPNLLNKSHREIKKWERFSASRSDDLIQFIAPASPINSYDLIKHSDSVVTYGSTIGVEAAFFGKNSILCGEAFHDHMDILDIAYTRDSLSEYLSRQLSNFDKVRVQENAVRYGFFHATGGVFISSLKMIGDISIQDPWFRINGVTLKPSRVASLALRCEKFVYARLNLQLARRCSHT